MLRQIILLVVLCWNSVQCVNDSPIIGVLVQEVRPRDPNNKLYGSYILTSYVEAVEASGARVVPVFMDKTPDYYTNKVKDLNGFLLPGGEADITLQSGYARSGRLVYEAVRESNSKGDNVPILGICLGMELLGLITSGKDLRTDCNVTNDALSLKFSPGFRNSSLYRDASESDIETLSKTSSTSNQHSYCLTEPTFKRYNVNDWTVLSTSQGAQSDVFISSMEIKGVPVAAIMFHPEKTTYDWKSMKANPHDGRSIATARLFYDWLVAQSRLNSHAYSNETQLLNDLIYNYSPTFTSKQGLFDFRNYYFK